MHMHISYMSQDRTLKKVAESEALFSICLHAGRGVPRSPEFPCRNLLAGTAGIKPVTI